jgi:hypothetical protein
VATLPYTLGILVALVLAAIALLHLYWAAGGSWGGAAAVPEVEGRPTFAPSPAGTLCVAVALLLAALIVLGQIAVWGDFLPRFLFRWGTWGVAAVFFLRALGEFRLVGFFKKVRGTRFARWDSALFSPLCLALSLALVVVAQAF